MNNHQQSDAALLRPIQIVIEAARKARHAIRKAFEAQRDFNKAGSENLGFELQEFTVRMAERAERGYPKL